ncbi:hypothetical protein [Pedobacter frigoris]|uniref:Uncharacterized protein n=1 Tax=Pedobacter frigoris TaxID=2571272 RepID=A0A4U1CHC6_9SPHI|nr:hypothetical protein [Pedobacter frigoris]TKC06174.1 hypothetical protein FA047_12685 [Pedobacter frigoris]
MNVISLNRNDIRREYAWGFMAHVKKEHAMVGVLLMVLMGMHGWFDDEAGTVAFIVKSTMPLLLMNLTSFMVIVALCWWLLQRAWVAMGLPEFENMVLQFKEMNICRQLGFYFASFVLLVWAVVSLLVGM